MVTVGVEEEYLLLDADSGHPVSRSAQVRATAGLRPAVLAGEVDRELLQAQVEVATPICDHLDELDGHLRRLRGALAVGAAEVGCLIAASGTAPVRASVPVTDEPRYQAMLRDAPQLVDEQLINGMHVHVAVPGREAGVAALNRIRPWVPVLVALAANSPVWEGSDTGFASWRTLVFGRWPVSGPPPAFRDAADYRHRTTALLRTGVIRDLGQIYWQARLSERYPTLEVRALDVQLLPEDAVTLAGVVRALVTTALGDAADGAPFDPGPAELLAAANWHSARHGLDDNLFTPDGGRIRPAAEVVAALLDRITPALKTSGDLDRVTDGVDRLLRDGNGATRQRRARDTGGTGALLHLLGLDGGGTALPPAV